MDHNPYESPDARLPARRTRPNRWLIWSGTALLLLAAACFVATILVMTFAFNSIANSGNAPKPSDLADSVRLGLILGMVEIPLGVIGVVLIIAGFIIRRPVDRS